MTRATVRRVNMDTKYNHVVQLSFTSKLDGFATRKSN